MIDFSWTQATLPTVTLSLFLYVCFVLCFFRYTRSRVTLNNSISLGLWLYAFVLVVYVCVDNDWYHYQQIISDYDFSARARNHGEKVYGVIARLVDRNYLLFRIIVWGGALLITTLTFKRFKINLNNAVYFIIAAFLLKFSYARATLAMACYFFGFSYLVIPIKKRRILSYLVAILMMWLSTEFHSSCSVLVVLTLGVFLPLNKYVIIGLVIFLPILGLYFKDFLDVVMTSEALSSNEYLYGKMTGYTNQVAQKANLLGIIYNIIQYSVFFAPLIFIVHIIGSGKNRIPVYHLMLYRVTVCIILLSSMFLFVDLETQVFFYRILYMSFIPLVILTIFLYEEGFLRKKYFLMLLFLGIISNLHRILLVLFKIINGTYILD